MEIFRGGSRPSDKGPAAWFTGAVRIDPLHSAADPARVASARVTFEPGARTAWHTHPLGQTLIVTDGCGWVQRAAGRKTLARRDGYDRNDAYRHSGKTERDGGRLDGKGQRRGLSPLSLWHGAAGGRSSSDSARSAPNPGRPGDPAFFGNAPFTIIRAPFLQRNAP